MFCHNLSGPRFGYKPDNGGRSAFSVQRSAFRSSALAFGVRLSVQVQDIGNTIGSGHR